MKNKKGQMTLEAVLIMTVMVSILTVISNKANEANLLTTLVQKPWSHIRGMIEDAYWDHPSKSKTKHPNLFSRRASARGDNP